MNIGEAVIALRAGLRVSRSGWNGKGMWLALAEGDGHRRLPYVYMRTADDKLVPWPCSQTDLLADDWGLVTP